MREAGGVYLDGGTLEFRGEHARVSGLVAEALRHLIDALNAKPAGCGFGPYRIDRHRLLYDDAVVVRLSKSEDALLRVLMAHGGRLVTPETLLGELYPEGNWPRCGILRVFVCRLRIKLRAAHVGLHIESEPGLGYSLQ